MRSTTILFVAFASLGCAVERDYAIGGCPAEVQSANFPGVVCDRGAGFAPRFVSVETCRAEAGMPVPAHAAFAGVTRSTHPSWQRCGASGVLLITYDDAVDQVSIH